MVTQDIPMVIADESIRRLAQGIGKDVEDGKLVIDVHCPSSFKCEFTRERTFYIAALTLIVELARWN